MKQIICFSLCFSILACSDPDRLPSGIIDKDKMEKIIWDMVQADQYSSNYLKKDSVRIAVKPETRKLYDEVFLLHHISREEFQKSWTFYLNHPELTKTMFDSLSAKANRRRLEVYRSYGTPKMNVK